MPAAGPAMPAALPLLPAEPACCPTACHPNNCAGADSLVGDRLGMFNLTLEGHAEAVSGAAVAVGCAGAGRGVPGRNTHMHGASDADGPAPWPPGLCLLPPACRCGMSSPLACQCWCWEAAATPRPPSPAPGPWRRVREGGYCTVLSWQAALVRMLWVAWTARRAHGVRASSGLPSELQQQRHPHCRLARCAPPPAPLSQPCCVSRRWRTRCRSRCIWNTLALSTACTTTAAR